MEHNGKSIRPFIGSKDFGISRQFYQDLGFKESILANNLSYFESNSLGFYLQDAYVKDWIDNTMIFMEVDDVHHQEIYADGKTIWIYLKKNKEVQITDMDDTSSDFLSPKQMMSLYNTGDFAYSIIEERNVNGQQFADIEFKPLTKKTDYTKMRLTVDKKTNKMISLRVFSRDGSRYTLKVSDIIANKKYESGIFTFNPKAAPGVHIEDLRID